MLRDTLPISWLKGARRDFDGFPQGAQIEMARALTILAEGRMPESKSGIETPKMELDLIDERLKGLREMLK